MAVRPSTRMKPEKKTGKKPAKAKPAPRAIVKSAAAKATSGKAPAAKPAKGKGAASVPAPVAKAAKIKVPKPAKAVREKPAAVRKPAKTAVPKAPKVALPKAEPPPAPAKPKRPSRIKKPLSIPPILLEGDAPPPPPLSGPGARYALTPETIVAQIAAPPGELPESYGTRNLFLAARDPHWLHASWDLAGEQQRAYNQRSRDGHLILRVFSNDELSPATPEIHLHPESRSWFVHVPRAETRYRAELGFYDAAGDWTTIATSRATFTPPDAPSTEVGTDFATIPPGVPFQKIVEVVREFVAEHQPLLHAVAQTTVSTEAPAREAAPPPAMGPEPVSISTPEPAVEIPKAAAEPAGTATAPPERPVPPAPPAVKPSRSYRAEIPVRIERRDPWSDDQARALARLISVDAFRRVWMGSLEITELVRRHLREEAASIAAADLARSAPLGLEQPPGLGAPSSIFLRPLPGRERGFWFKVNAELIIYGSTEADARVTIAGRPIKLRPDGTFSFRFSLPDGRYQLPAIAISRAGDDGREARLEFSRTTEYRGQVQAHPQDETLRPPRAENVA